MPAARIVTRETLPHESQEPAMTKLPPAFASLTSLEQDFGDGLAAMLERHRGLGVYILVLANAAYDPLMWRRLAPALQTRHAELAESISAQLREGRKLSEPDDDIMVFLKLMAIGFDRVQTVQSRLVGPWQLCFNPVRALRPPRMSGTSFGGLLRPFDAAGFHFNKPFLAREILWQGELAGKPARLLYNKFPFARLHGLLVPEPERELPQYLTPELHGWAWEVCAQAGAFGLCLGYNSVSAGASVNHLHFQSFVSSAPLPVQMPLFQHNGGGKPYPLPCQVYHDPETAWFALDELHRHNQPYNLVYAANRLHLVARVPQGSPALSTLSQGWGWSEAAGTITLFTREEYERLEAAEIEFELARLMPAGA